MKEAPSCEVMHIDNGIRAANGGIVPNLYSEKMNPERKP